MLHHDQDDDDDDDRGMGTGMGMMMKEQRGARDANMICEIANTCIVCQGD